MSAGICRIFPLEFVHSRSIHGRVSLGSFCGSNNASQVGARAGLGAIWGVRTASDRQRRALHRLIFARAGLSAIWGMGITRRAERVLLVDSANCTPLR